MCISVNLKNYLRFPLTNAKQFEIIRSVLLEEFGLDGFRFGAPRKQEDFVQSLISIKRIERIAKEIDHVLGERQQEADR